MLIWNNDYSLALSGRMRPVSTELRLASAQCWLAASSFIRCIQCGRVPCLRDLYHPIIAHHAVLPLRVFNFYSNNPWNGWIMLGRFCIELFQLMFFNHICQVTYHFFKHNDPKTCYCLRANSPCPRGWGWGGLGRHAPQVVCTSKFYIICFGRKQGSKLYFGQIAGKMGGQNYTFVSPWSSNIIVAQTLAEAGCPVQVSDFFDHLRWWARYARSECVPETRANTEDNAVEVGHTNTS